MVNVTIWNEYTTEEEKSVYPKGIHGQIADFLSAEGDIDVTLATLSMPEHGLSDEVLNKTDVLIWWGHIEHNKVEDSVVEKVYDRVQRGMGLIVLHSAHHSKIFTKLMGTSCNLKWREPDRERVWCIMPNHPIAEGIPETFVLEIEEMYGERFDVPTPEDTIFLSWFKGGEVFRSGCTWTRGMGKIFYFQPGHETFKSFYNKYVQTIIKNSVRWANPIKIIDKLTCPQFGALE